MAKSFLLDPEAVRRRLVTRFRNNHRQWFAGEGAWPITVPLGLPTEQQTKEQLSAVQQWAERWQRWQGDGEVVWTQRHWSQLGTQKLPEKLLVQSPSQVARWLGEETRWQRAGSRRQWLSAKWPPIAAELARHFNVLADYSDEDFQRLVAVLEWLTEYPDSGLYIRQLPIRGVDSKWIETRKTLILDLLQSIRQETQRKDFHAVTGIRREPVLMRFRVLDAALRRAVGGLGDISAPVEEIAGLELPLERVVIVENLQTGLAFGELPGALLFMRLGYAVDLFASIRWLQQTPCFYWGDIDTHGFAILNRLRHYLPNVKSLLMDEATLNNHLALCGVEEKQAELAGLERLEPAEKRLFEQLVESRWGPRLRLEQERIEWRYAWQRIVEKANE